jgi:hypothetical protein
MRLKMGAVRSCPLPASRTRAAESASPEESLQCMVERDLAALLERDLQAWEVAIAVVARAKRRSKRVS